MAADDEDENGDEQRSEQFLLRSDVCGRRLPGVAGKPARTCTCEQVVDDLPPVSEKLKLHREDQARKSVRRWFGGNVPAACVRACHFYGHIRSEPGEADRLH